MLTPMEFSVLDSELSLLLPHERTFDDDDDDLAPKPTAQENG